MNILHRLSQVRLLRSMTLPVLKLISTDIKIKHHFTGEEFSLNSFKHKGYWFHGKDREADEMLAIKSLINKDDCVIEVGGHIGYLSLLFSHQIEDHGKLYVFEPGTNNLPYLKKNLFNKGNTQIIDAGCGDKNEELTFFQDDYSGQNNSFIDNFSALSSNLQNAPGIKVNVKQQKVRVMKLDDFIADKNLNPSFIKIDTEGFELPVLIGLKNTLTTCPPPIIMIEIQKEKEEVMYIFTSVGYTLYNTKAQPISSIDEINELNYFALSNKFHSKEINNWQKNLQNLL